MEDVSTLNLIFFFSINVCIPRLICLRKPDTFGRLSLAPIMCDSKCLHDNFLHGFLYVSNLIDNQFQSS